MLTKLKIAGKAAPIAFPAAKQLRAKRFSAKLPGAQAGVILIEALVGILIFAIGILALIGLQAAAIVNTAEAKYRSDAALLASQIVTKIWIDKTGAASYATTSGAVNNQEVAMWLNDVALALPQSTGANAPVVSVESKNGGFNVTVTIKWQKPGQSQHQFVSVARIDHNT